MIDIKTIANTVIRGEKAIVFPLQIHDNWVSDQNGHHILDIRGWGFLQYADRHLDGMDKSVAYELQDGIGQWVVDSLNQAWELQK